MRKIAILISILFGSNLLVDAQNNRVAIVFGMSDYQNVGSITNCKNDADSMANVLQSLNFRVFKWTNLSLRRFSDEIDNWGRVLSQYDVALFYYSGHGAEVDGENYLFPIDSKAASESDVKFETMPVGKILGKMEDAINSQNSRLRCNIVILDACRDNPFSKSWSKSLGDEGGLANVVTPDGTFIGFAAKPGKKASASGLTNSPYTQSIIKHIRTPNRTIDGIFTDVNSTTRYLTGGKQTPYKNSSLDNDFYFIVSSSSQTKSIAETDRDNIAANRIKDLLNNIDFDKSINDLIIEEYGARFNNSVAYSSLPIAGDCKSKEIKYYWRKIGESKFRDKIYNVFSSNDLMKYISDDSYIMYSFYDNKLYNIIVRVFFKDIIFHQRMGQALGVDLDKYPTQFHAKNGGSYSIYSLSPEFNLTTLVFGKKDTESFCDNDWWSIK